MESHLRAMLAGAREGLDRAGLAGAGETSTRFGEEAQRTDTHCGDFRMVTQVATLVAAAGGEPRDRPRVATRLKWKRIATLGDLIAFRNCQTN
jgi:hypothetical protein